MHILKLIQWLNVNSFYLNYFMYVSFSMDFEDQSGSPTAIRKAKLEKQVRVVLHAWPQFHVSYSSISCSSSTGNNRQVVRLLSAEHASCPDVRSILCQYLQISFHTWIIRTCIFFSSDATDRAVQH